MAGLPFFSLYHPPFRRWIAHALKNAIELGHILRAGQHVDQLTLAALILDGRKQYTVVLGLPLKLGQIARLVAKNLSGFGVRILAADPYIDQSVGDQYGVTMVDMKTLFRESDYISLHVPLIEGTEHLIGKELFDEIPDHLVFINSARGGVVVEQEMIDAIDSGKISYAYLDVLTDEYPDLNTHPLANRDNVILTPHVAFYSQESARDGRLQCCADIRNYFTGNYDKCVFVPGGNNVQK